MTVKALPGLVLVEPIKRSAGRSSSISGFEFEKPKYEGTPNTGKVYSIGADITDPGFDVGDTVVFNNEPTPDGFRVGELRLMAMPVENIGAKLP